MTAAGPARAIVRLRWMRGMVTSASMPLDDAEVLADSLLHDVLDCGDGTGFVPFAGFDGRKVQVRGRDVIEIEMVPDGPSTPHTRATASAVAVAHSGTVEVQVSGSALSGDPIAPGTAFLRQQRSQSVSGSSR